MFTDNIKYQLHRVRNYFNNNNARNIRQRAMRTPFSASAGIKLILITQAERIPQSQIFPFHYYADELKKVYGVEVREADLDALLGGQSLPHRNADVVAFQTPFNISDEELNRLVQILRDANNKARLVYLDWFSPTDLRNAQRLDPLISVYVKKHVFRDRGRYGLPTIGDTNLTDYYSRKFGLSEPTVRFPIPPGFLDKLLVGPSFATAPGIMPRLLGGHQKPASRPIDVHARFTVEGTPWYQSMRGESDAAVRRLSNCSVAYGHGVSLGHFMTELNQSKICFSPFGYGEVCWRDYEAVVAGAVLLKPDMSHIETAPDIFVPWETYIPVAWDLSDLEERVKQLKSDAELRARVTETAFTVLHDWLLSDKFARTMKPLFD
jgi:hypothetical protein